MFLLQNQINAKVNGIKGSPNQIKGAPIEPRLANQKARKSRKPQIHSTLKEKNSEHKPVIRRDVEPVTHHKAKHFGVNSRLVRSMSEMNINTKKYIDTDSDTGFRNCFKLFLLTLINDESS